MWAAYCVQTLTFINLINLYHYTICINFRIMAGFDPSTVVKGPCYVFKIKSSKQDYTGGDLVYGVIYKGDKKYGFMDFRSLCDEKNNLFFLGFKVNDGENCTWQDCLDDMDANPPRGTPLDVSDRPLSFEEVAFIAYEKEIFTDKKGLTTLKKKTAKRIKPVQKVPPPRLITERQVLLPNIADTVQQSEQLSSSKTQQAQKWTADKSHGFTFLAGLGGNEVSKEEVVTTSAVSDFVVIEDDDNDDGKSGGGNSGGARTGIDGVVEQRTYEYWKEMALAAKYRAEALEEDKAKLGVQIVALEANLHAAEQQSIKFMAEMDKKDQLLRFVNDDMAATIVAKLTPKLEPISVVAKKTGEILDQVKALPIAMIGTALGEMRVRNDTNFDAVHDGVSKINDVLDYYGLVENEDEDEEENVNIPEAVKYAFNMAKY